MVLCAMTIASTSSAATILHEQFADDPIAAGRGIVTAGDGSRFHYESGALTAAYDTSRATARLAWPLARSLDATTNFRWNVSATLLADGFSADPNHFAQLAFGLINANTTGGDRAGGNRGDAFDVVSIDYFPNVSPIFGGPSLAPTVIGSDVGVGFFSSIQFPFGNESELNDEGPLPFDVPLEFELDYAAEESWLTLRVASGGQPLPLNANQPDIAPGGVDGDAMTIQLSLNPGTTFSLDQFAILLWEDTFLDLDDPASVRATMRFDEILVSLPDAEVAGDTNSDGVVGLDDLNNVRNDFGATGIAVSGDTFPRDGIVNLDDLNRVRNHFGEGNSQAVPEPSALLLATAALLWGMPYHGWRRLIRRGNSSCRTTDLLTSPRYENITAARGMRASPPGDVLPSRPTMTISSIPCAKSTESAGSAKASPANGCFASAQAAANTASSTPPRGQT